MSKRISRLLVQPRNDRLSKVDQSDPQKHLVYRMERDIVGWAIYTHVDYDDLQMIADYACRKYGVKRVGITIENCGKKRVFGWCEDNTIHLNADYHGDNTAVLLHELAHYIAGRKYPDADHNHGPEFVHVYGSLLGMFNCLPYWVFEFMCKDHDVEISGGSL